MPANVLMFQGTGSDVGKSTLVMGLCRLAVQRGLRVAPFKPQNMSNNAAACESAGEIGRAQALQAIACGVSPHVDFNPVLLKPQSDRTAQIVVHGKVLKTSSAMDYMTNQRASLLEAVVESFYRLAKQYDLILVEGAGSPAEINLRQHDIANMGFAREVGAPVCLIGDIDRGGVIAAIAGTQQVIDKGDADLISSFIINRFRGDPVLFDDGIKSIESITQWPCRGLVPWLPQALALPQEDAVVLGDVQSSASHSATKTNKLRIVVPMLSRIANFDDMDPLRAEPHVELLFIPPGNALPLDADVVIIPGTKSTIADLEFMKMQGWDHDIHTLARHGKRVLGICGGYQLLGKTIADTQGIEGEPKTVAGLGLLDVHTQMTPEKTVQPVNGHCLQSQCKVTGYEIHIGSTSGTDTSRPLFAVNGEKDGASSKSGTVSGTYLHGLFNSDAFRSSWLLRTGGRSSDTQYAQQLQSDIDSVANALDRHLDIDALLKDAKPVSIPA